MKNILITGINGGAGSYLAEYIVKNHPECSVMGTARTQSLNRHINYLKNKVKLSTTDLCDLASTFRMLNLYRPDTIFHFASLANVRDSFNNPLLYINNNINLTLNLLEAIRMIKDIDGYNPLVMLCSTSEVYGNPDKKNVPINEDCPLQPVNPYAVSKMAQDNLGTVYHKSFGLRVIKTRMFTYLNARRNDLFASAFARQILEIENGRKEVLEHGNLDSVRTIIDVRDAVEAYWICVEKGEVGETYNIGGEVPISVGGVLDLLKAKAKVPIKTLQSSTLTRPQDVSFQIPDVAKFRLKTGWAPKYTLDESIDFFLSEIRNNYV